jgi:hypothetical protein
MLLKGWYMNLKKYFSEMGKKGGSARALSLSPEKRRKIALKAVKIRWKNKSKIIK